MIQFFTLTGGYGLPSLSPFCVKLEVYLRLAEIEYKRRGADLQKAPRGKVPYIQQGDQLIGDSGLIIERLEASLERPLDAGLSEAQRGLGHVIRRTCEEHLYWGIVYSRWVDDAGWAHQHPKIKAFVPAALSWVLPGVLRSGVKKTLHHHGLGRHDPATLYKLACDDLDALSRLLGEQPFFLGDAPRTADCAAHAMIWHCLASPFDNPLTARVKAHGNLVDYVERMNQRLDWSADELSD
jgi:glutathione S-transferase